MIEAIKEFAFRVFVYVFAAFLFLLYYGGIAFIVFKALQHIGVF
jgi:hypothetical protein